MPCDKSVPCFCIYNTKVRGHTDVLVILFVFTLFFECFQLTENMLIGKPYHIPSQPFFAAKNQNIFTIYCVE